MSGATSTNGREIIRIDRKGRKWFALGDGEPFEVDVVVVQNDWLAIDRGYRDAQNNVPPEQLAALNQAAWSFAKGVSRTEDITLAEALEFLARITEEADKLAGFFKPRSSAAPSSPKPTAVTFSE